MKSPTTAAAHPPSREPHFLASRFQSPFVNAAALGIAGLAAFLIAAPLNAALFTYSRTTSNTSGTADQWSAGTSWNTTPVSAADTTLTFGTGPLAAGATIFTNNNNAGDFKLNILNFTYAGPSSGTQPTVTISGNRLEFITSATTPTMSIAATGTIKPLLTISNDLLLTNNLSINATSNGIFSGTISGGGSLTKLGGGSLTLSGANTYSGGTTWGDAHAVGVMSFGSSSVGGPGSITSGPIGTGTFTLSNTGAASGNFLQSTDSTTRTISNAIVINGGTDTNFGGTGNLIFDGTVALGTGNRTFAVNNTNTTFSGIISNSGSITKAGTGTLTLSGANTYTGTTTVTGGTLLLGADNTLSTSTAPGATRGVTLSGGTLDVAGTTQGNSGTGARLGTLTLTLNSTLSLNLNDATQDILFNDFNRTGGLLTITNWTGIAGGSGAAGRILFATSANFSATELEQISFSGFSQGAQLISFGNGFNELTPIPEPSAAMVAVGLLGWVGWRERRRETTQRRATRGLVC